MNQTAMKNDTIPDSTKQKPPTLPPDEPPTVPPLEAVSGKAVFYVGATARITIQNKSGSYEVTCAYQ